MYSFSEQGGYAFTTTTETYQQSSQTFQKTTTTELQWEFTSDGYAKVQASDLLFKDDSHNTPVKVVVTQHEEETEHQKCQTWYVPTKPMEKPSRSQEYVAPHKRYEGYDRTHNHTGKSNIRARTISSSGESSHYAQSRSQSRHSHKMPNNRRSASRSSYRANHAPAVSRERPQPRPQLMSVVNLTRKTKRASTRNQRVSQRQTAHVPTEATPRARKVNGVWIKGHVEPKPKVCYQFLNTGCCSYGDRCRFAHVEKKSKRQNNTRAPYRRQTVKRNQQVPTTTTSYIAPNRFDFSNDAAW